MLVTKKAPDFTAKAVLANNEMVDFNLHSNLGEKGAVLFFYPFDFTFVCPTELVAFNNRHEEFKKRGINVIAVSIDSHHTHLAWKNTAIDKGGVGDLKYPMVADVTKEISQAYDVLLPGGMALRGSFLIDKDGTVRHAVINDLPLGRNIDEMLRMVDAMLYTNEHGEVCPAGWSEGKSAMKANKEGVSSFLAANAEKL
ncbi:MAG: peroxiredoxin [Candidatus Sericytochromatia bacterium]